MHVMAWIFIFKILVDLLLVMLQLQLQLFSLLQKRNALWRRLKALSCLYSKSEGASCSWFA